MIGILLALLHTVCFSEAVSLNPLAPNVYWPGAQLPVSVNKVTSTKHAREIDFYDLPFVCHPKDGASKTALSMDEVLRGDRLMTSDFDLHMLENERCRILCTKQLNANEIQEAHALIKQGYRVEWYVDGLPGATSFTTHDKTRKYYSSGFPLGEMTANGHSYLHNHFTFVIKYRHSDNHDDTRVILAFEVYPRSLVMTENDRRSANLAKPGSCEIDILKDPNAPRGLELLNTDKSFQSSLNVTYSYSVYFREDLDIHYVDRWDLYFYFSDKRIVWYSTLISATICLSLSAAVALIMSRTLSKDISAATRNQKQEFDVSMEDAVGWRVLRGDVFRTPEDPESLSTLVGSGLQMFLAILALFIRRKFTSFGFFLLLFACVFSGFQSSRTYQSYGGEGWLRIGFYTALAFPTACFALLTFLNFCIWAQGSVSVVPMRDLFELAGFQLGGALPLVLIGAYAGTHMMQEVSGRTSALPRQIPKQPFYTRYWPSLLIAGALPYAAICVELYFIAKSFQLHQDGYLSFICRSLILVLVVAMIASMQTTITLVYMLLNHEDHRWQWRAAQYGAASVGYIFFHAIFYYFTKLQYGFVSGIVYFGYTILLCSLYGVIQGALGYFISSIFVHKIYDSMKVD